MRASLKKTVPFLMMAFALAGCGDNAAEKAAKPELINDIVENSISLCSKGPTNDSDSAYRNRLEEVLQETPYQDLKTLKDHNITICLDQRLSKQENGTFDKRIDGIFYPQRDGGIVALWDDGRRPDEAGFWTLDTYDYADQALEKLADAVRDGDTPQNGDLMYAARYTYSTGKSSYSVTKWRDADDFDGDSIRKNPALQKPPVKRGYSTPGS